MPLNALTIDCVLKRKFFLDGGSRFFFPDSTLRAQGSADENDPAWFGTRYEARTYEPGLALKPPLGITGEYFDHLTDRRKQQVQQRSHIAEMTGFLVAMGQRKHQVIIGGRQHSDWRLMSHFSLVMVWHLGQCRFLHEL